MIEKIFLTESDLERAIRVADIRNSKNGQVPNYRETREHTDHQIHFQGTLGEVAVCKRTGFPVDEHFSYGGDDGAPDLYWFDMRVEVKTPTHRPPILKLNRLIEFSADLCIVCYAYSEKASRNYGTVEIWGGVSRFRFLRDHYEQDFGQGMRVCFNPELLTPLADIERIHKHQNF